MPLGLIVGIRERGSKLEKHWPLAVAVAAGWHRQQRRRRTSVRRRFGNRQITIELGLCLFRRWRLRRLKIADAQIPQLFRVNRRRGAVHHVRRFLVLGEGDDVADIFLA